MFWFIQRFTYQFLWFRILLRFWITDVFVEALDRNFCGNGFFCSCPRSPKIIDTKNCFFLIRKLMFVAQKDIKKINARVGF